MWDERIFWSKVDRGRNCWPWLGLRDREGYGRYSGTARAHRVAYELAVGPIPDGFTIDHLCRMRHCVRPEHLEAVSIQTNLARRPRKQQCPAGHAFDDVNTHVRANGKRECRICIRDRQRVRRAAERVEHSD